MPDLLFHPRTNEHLKQFVKSPFHALLLIAPEGSGKRTIALYLAIKLLDLPETINPEEHAAILHLQPVNRTISIDAVRELQKRLQLKTVGKQTVRRIVVIEAAHRLTVEAQNALLKMLEEPPLDTVFILTVPTARSVLPTIYSRTQALELKSPSKDDLIGFLKDAGFSEDKVLTALRYSSNRIGLAQALLQEDDAHPLLAAVNSAREILSSPLVKRLSKVDEWAKQKEELPDKLDTLERICQTGLVRAASKDDQLLIKRWERYYRAVYETKASLVHSPNAKLLLTNLFLRLG